MKTFVWMVLVCLGGVINAQSLSVRFGHSLTPADHVSLRYEHWTNGVINFTLAGFAERSKSHSLNLTSYGGDLLAEYASSRMSDALPLFGWRAGLGVTCQTEKDPWLYKGLASSHPVNYGIVGELSGEWFMTDVFRLSLFAQQKLLLNSRLGSRRSCFGIGLTYLFPTY